MQKGLVVPSNDNGVHIANDDGWYGKGIYLSPEMCVARNYGDTILVCSVILGRKYRCWKIINGKPCKKGYDTHLNAHFNIMREYILFDPAQVLPCYLITKA
eukprot:TRINITY_DN2616_c1_g1_i3.p1 TRINITY_DN2616_c1_g1~~TRINITY_DN2616_c1_g1_i3.p1  ORF type:complete len:101 (-),score=17.66 TRINITY_DN2616_c1_g1_i3:154-456(-)